MGITDPEIDALSGDSAAKPAAADLEIALRYAELVAADANDVTDAVFEQLRQHYTDAQIVELTCVVGLGSYFNRFSTALAIDPTGESEPAAECACDGAPER